jgi:hypothetical protein
LGEETFFVRTVKISFIGDDEAKVEATINWRESFGDFSVVLEERIFNWL